MAEAVSNSASESTQAAADAQVRADIDSAEAFTSGIVNETRAYNHNLKRLIEVYQQLDLKLAQDYADLGVERARKAQTMWEDTHSELQKDLAEIRGRRMKQFDDAATVSFQEAQRTVREGDLANDRQWNIDEVSDLSAKSGLQADAIAATIIKAVADALAKQVEKQTA